MIDISAQGTLVIIKSKAGSLNLRVNQNFSFDGSPLTAEAMDAADGEVDMNGDLVSWAKYAAVRVSLSFIPNCGEERQLRDMLYVSRESGESCKLESITVLYPDKSGVKYLDGRLMSGSAALDVQAEGRLGSTNYRFTFARVKPLRASGPSKESGSVKGFGQD